MLRGERVGLRARHESDLPVLMDELYNDVATRARADSRPWVPVSPGSKKQPYLVEDDGPGVACFSVVELDGGDVVGGDVVGGELVGEALLWGIDTYNRMAHIGLSIRPTFRGRGFGSDIVAVLCHYGFVVRGLHRLQIDTLADNEAMKRAALRSGFALEATFHKAAWVTGAFVDEVALGLLAADWTPRST